jgi:hypothetical protein
VNPDALPDLSQLPGMPHWLGPALLVLAVLIVIAGPHGLRLTNGALLGLGFFCAAFFGLRGGQLHEWLHGAVAIPAGTIGLLLGLLLPALGTGVVLAVLCAGLGFVAAKLLKLSVFEVPAGAGAFIGFWFGLTQHKRISIWLPPIFAALFASAGVQLFWHVRYSQLIKLIATAVLAALLVAIAFERARRERKRSAEGAKRVADEELRRRVAEQQAEYRRIYGEDH